MLDGHHYTFGTEVPTETTIFIGGSPNVESLPNLEAVIVPWAGIPVRLTESLAGFPDVKVFNLHHNAQAVAEHALGLLISAARRIALVDHNLRKGDWSDHHEGNYIALRGRTVCLLGFGAIGRALKPLLEALGMRVVAVRTKADEQAMGIADLDRALAESNFLVISLPITKATEGLIGSHELKQLVPPRIVVNVGRGPVVQEEALYTALTDGTLHAAGIDVWYQYPTAGESKEPGSYPFGDCDNLVMTPHMGGNADDIDALRYLELGQLLTQILRSNWPQSVALEKVY